ncbi:hypothetical protein GO984_09815 [Rhodobacteraceae bacterium CY05]|uniref:TNase-like domain-containing protein n=2 Tax=Parasedimentitalea huanghaiensis TaxID=2682100 RepID=A0A6L6WFR1_9RHOB|nr:hypothetical protein [Zongyanglinia huanghaiensis]
MARTMMIKQTLTGVAFAIVASGASSTELQQSDPISARIFLELHSIQKLAGNIRPLVSAPGQAFRVIDGEVLALGKLKIRLIGIDVPEAAQQCNSQSGDSWDCAGRASDRVQDIMDLAERVECFSSQPESRGHYIATCDADGQDVGALLVAEGLAWPDRNQGYYQPEVSTAQADGLGIWQAHTPPPWEWRQEQH